MAVQNSFLRSSGFDFDIESVHEGKKSFSKRRSESQIKSVKCNTSDASFTKNLSLNGNTY